jgi:hypothetical protein
MQGDFFETSYKFHEYTIPIKDCFSLDLPAGAKIVTAQMVAKRKKLLLFVLENTKSRSLKIREFLIFQAGTPIQVPIDRLKYITAFLNPFTNSFCLLFESV